MKIKNILLEGELEFLDKKIAVLEWMIDEKEGRAPGFSPEQYVEDREKADELKPDLVMFKRIRNVVLNAIPGEKEYSNPYDFYSRGGDDDSSLDVFDINLASGEIVQDVSVLYDKRQITKDTKVYYELVSGILSGVVRSGVYTEVHEPIRFRNEDTMIDSPEYLRHHGFVFQKDAKQKSI